MVQDVADLSSILAEELGIPRLGIERSLSLFAEGATIPFVARYRKEMTGSLDEVQLGKIKERAEYLKELEERRNTVLQSIAGQGKLTAELEARIRATRSKTELEDLYLPFKPKRRTRATIARERGLEPLAEEIWAQRESLAATALELASAFVCQDKGVPDADAAWQGARDIVAEGVSELAAVRAGLRDLALQDGALSARCVTGKEQEGKKYSDYFEFEETARTIPSHRLLALRRGEKEGMLKVSLRVDREASLAIIRAQVVRSRRAALADQLEMALVDSYDRLLCPSIEVDVRLVLKERADSEAIRVFGENLRHLLLAPPLGGKRMLAIDPGLRTGCKVVAIDEKGDLLADQVIYPHEPHRREGEAKRMVSGMVKDNCLEAIAIGNGTAGRETEAFVRTMKTGGLLPENVLIVTVNESGASVYSAS
ncbi:MAG: Tex-like N-terminal domain-containing protein, partial [Pseudomonadota bacterium]